MVPPHEVARRERAGPQITVNAVDPNSEPPQAAGDGQASVVNSQNHYRRTVYSTTNSQAASLLGRR